ncbi:dihydrofolate reductase family protein [Ferrimicrobium sp.]|uniref:dihydrofolate reductase family protein n=1 Tax=Ferrimicrobium sp. TaxID=2926050 RepID=UPI00260A7DB6|nr:dihydrofolate reductase family protein [Ferrimicrobium sp.]
MFVSDGTTPSYEQLLERYPVTNAAVLRANMVTSLDGRVTIDGRSKGLSTSLDRRIFHLLRATAQVILVGSGTARLENYQAPQLAPELIQLRQQVGLTQPLRIVIASRQQPLDSTPAHSPGDPPAIVWRHLPDQLSRNELERVLRTDPNQPGGILCEGGPTLLGNLLQRGLVDQLCITLRHMVVGGEGAQLVSTGLEIPADFDLTDSISTRQATFLRLTHLN